MSQFSFDTFSILGAILFGLFCLFVGFVHLRRISWYLLFCSLIFFTVAIYSSWIKNSETIPPLQQTVQLKDSTAHSGKFSAGFSFNSNSDEVGITLGGNIYTFSKSELSQKNRHARPITLAGYIPFKLYLDNGKLFVDIDAWRVSEMPMLRIVRNVVTDYPPLWDWNFNDNALEIVDTSMSPIIQIIYRSEDNILIRGIFKSKNSAIFATENQAYVLGGRYLQHPPDIRLERIFKYPSWKYPNQSEKP